MTRATQKAALRRAFEAGLTLTPRGAQVYCGCDRLAARVAELRAEGMVISSTLREVDGKRYAEYCAPAYCGAATAGKGQTN